MAINDMIAQQRADREAARDARRADRDARKAARNAERDARRAARDAERGFNDPGAGTSAADSAFDQFRNYTGYEFRLGEGTDAINAAYAARGLLESGAAQKSLTEYGQNIASAEFGNYMNYLGNQQALGATAASASTGVGSNYGNTMAASNANYANALTGLNTGFANSVTGLNNNMANAQSTYANNVGNAYGNAAIANANNSNALIGGIGGAVNGALGALTYQGFGGGGGPVNLLAGTPYA